jgi:hypothetical protein
VLENNRTFVKNQSVNKIINEFNAIKPIFSIREFSKDKNRGELDR